LGEGLVGGEVDEGGAGGFFIGPVGRRGGEGIDGDGDELGEGAGAFDADVGADEHDAVADFEFAHARAEGGDSAHGIPAEDVGHFWTGGVLGLGEVAVAGLTPA